MQILLKESLFQTRPVIVPLSDFTGPTVGALLATLCGKIIHFFGECGTVFLENSIIFQEVLVPMCVILGTMGISAGVSEPLCTRAAGCKGGPCSCAGKVDSGRTEGQAAGIGTTSHRQKGAPEYTCRHARNVGCTRYSDSSAPHCSQPAPMRQHMPWVGTSQLYCSFLLCVGYYWRQLQQPCFATQPVCLSPEAVSPTQQEEFMPDMLAL